MCSFVVRNDVLQMVFALPVLVLGAGCEELLPKFCGIGFPILLTSVQFLPTRVGMPVAVLFAVAAGCFEDAISGLAPMTSVSYFLVVAVLARWTRLPRGLTLLTYPFYQLWLAVWIGGVNVFTRILLAFPIGFLTAFVVVWILSGTMERAAIDER